MDGCSLGLKWEKEMFAIYLKAIWLDVLDVTRLEISDDEWQRRCDV